MTDIALFLTENGIPFTSFEHVAVFTCEESEKLPPMPGASTKNLFLRDKKGTRHILVSVPHEKQVRLSALADTLGIGNLSFASKERLMKYLGVEPGSVTLLGLLNDASKSVEVIIDASLWSADALQCHPLRNTATYVIPRDGLERFFTLTGHMFQVIDVPAHSEVS